MVRDEGDPDQIRFLLKWNFDRSCQEMKISVSPPLSLSLSQTLCGLRLLRQVGGIWFGFFAHKGLSCLISQEPVFPCTHP